MESPNRRDAKETPAARDLFRLAQNDPQGWRADDAVRALSLHGPWTISVAI